MNAGPMINRCFRHQHPECYGREMPPEAEVPASLRWGGDNLAPSSQVTEPEPMGNGEDLGY